MDAARRQEAEAIYTHGVLRPIAPLDLQEDERVHLIIEPMQPVPGDGREAALARLWAGIARMSFRSDGPYPTREELHDQH